MVQAMDMISCLGGASPQIAARVTRPHTQQYVLQAEASSPSTLFEPRLRVRIDGPIQSTVQAGKPSDEWAGCFLLHKRSLSGFDVSRS